MSAIKFPVTPETYAKVDMLSKPATAARPETIPFVYFDSQDLATNWATQSFFATPQTDKTLGNIEQGGQMPADTYFQIWSFNLDFLVGAVDVGATADAVNDLLGILYTARAALQLTIANKTYGPIPLTYLHSSGRATITIANSDATATDIVNFAQTEQPDGGYWVDGAIILPPSQSFSVQIIGAPVTLTATRKVRLSMAGVKYRPIR